MGTLKVMLPKQITDDGIMGHGIGLHYTGK
jgi:hypothetical protein